MEKLVALLPPDFGDGDLHRACVAAAKEVLTEAPARNRSCCSVIACLKQPPTPIPAYVAGLDKVGWTVRPIFHLSPALDVARGKLVVVIDHDPVVLESMRGLLCNWDCRVVTAATPEAALTEVRRIGCDERPDLIISDYHLADGQSGITAIAKLREAYGAVPAFLMSGDTASERLREARESGHHLLHKPVQPVTLRAMVNRFLKSGKKQP